MAALNRRSLNVLSDYGVHPNTIATLRDEQMNTNILLNDLKSETMVEELGDIGIGPEEVAKIQRWKNATNLPPSAPSLRRQYTVSESLLHELVHNSGLRTQMDDLMGEVRDFKYLEDGKRYDVVLHNQNDRGFKSRVQNAGQSIYYRWDKVTSSKGLFPQAFHLTLNHTENEKHANLEGVHREKNGALHLRLNDGHTANGMHGTNSGGTLCRILITLVGEEYVISLSLPKTNHQSILPVAEKIRDILIKYYRLTDRVARKGEIKGKGQGKGSKSYGNRQSNGKGTGKGKGMGKGKGKGTRKNSNARN
jgi:hypothetical protein